jgi:hypothetical protein
MYCPASATSHRRSLRVGWQIPQHDPGDEGMIPTGVGVQRARHIRVDLLVVGRRLE